MESRAHALAAGLFTLLLGAACVLAVWWFSGDREGVNRYELISTGVITGLNQQAQVRYRGVAAGKVTDIRVDPQDRRNIIVSIEVNDRLPLTRGTRATLGYQGVTGLAYVQLDDRGGDTTPLAGVAGAPPQLSLESGALDQIADRTMDALRRFGKLTDRMGAFFDERNLARFNATLVKLESAAAGLDRTFDEAPATLAAVRNAFSVENVRRLSAALANLEHVSGEAKPAVDDIRALMVRTTQLMATMDKLALTAGDTLLENTLPQLNSLLRELDDTSAQMRRLINEVESSPQVLISGRGVRRPGPGEPGFDPARP